MTGCSPAPRGLGPADYSEAGGAGSGLPRPQSPNQEDRAVACCYLPRSHTSNCLEVDPEPSLVTFRVPWAFPRSEGGWWVRAASYLQGPISASRVAILGTGPPIGFQPSSS